MPMDFEPLMVDVQRGVPCLWALLNPHSDKRRVTFRVIGTGHPIPDIDELMYVGSYQLHGGALVFHVFTKGLR